MLEQQVDPRSRAGLPEVTAWMIAKVSKKA